MAWIKRQDKNTVPEIVMERTGMTLENLKNDKRRFHYPNIKEAAKLTHEHMARNSKIWAYGDYDVDGICSIFILRTTFEKLGYKNVDYVAPRRFSDGYGINVARVKELHESGCDLLITIDNGIAALDAIALARKLGMEVIVLDHHDAFVNESGEVELPDANIIVDPHITGGYVIGDESHTFDDLCGAGIGYYFAQELFQQSNMNPNDVVDTAKELTIAAGIATVADLVELIDDNRRIVKSALKLMNEGYGTKGLRVLMEQLNIERVSSADIAFGIGPCLNASGRLYDTGAEMMVQLLSYRKDDSELLKMVSDAIETNDNRKDMTKKAIEKAEDMMLERGADNTIVLLDEDLSPGIAGLVSSKLTETYYRPSIMLTKNAMNICKGSGRSIPEVNLKGLLDQVQSFLLGYGGHPMAAGLSLKAENVDAFRDAICKVTPYIPIPKDRYYDVESEPDKDNLMKIFNDIDRLEPFGQGNAPLNIMIKGIKLGDSMGNTYRKIGSQKEHIKFITKYGFDILWFDGAGEYKLLGEPKEIDVIGTLGLNTFKGKTTLQVLVERLRKSE